MTKERSRTAKQTQPVILSPEEKELSLKLHSARTSNLIWHFLTLGLMVASFVVLWVTIDCYDHRKTRINVLTKPLPDGYYRVSELPDDDLLSFGEEFVNLVATYQPSIAEKQFLYAFDMSSGAFKNKFKEKFVKKEVKEIRQSRRSQIFYAYDEPKLTRFPNEDYVVVSLDGELEKYADERSIMASASYQVKLKTIPHSKMSEYGISVVDLRIDTDSGY